jgi:hypothetical protein
MKAVTSLSFNRIERQQYCVKTWQDRGLDVIAVQSPEEINKLKDLFPSVNFKEHTNTSANIFSKDTPEIYALTKIAEEVWEECLLINSDISIKDNIKNFYEFWTPEIKTFKIGIRWDCVAGKKARTKQKWGIDVFLITPEMVNTIPNLGFRIGCPGWDFWLIYHFHLLGYKITPTQSKLFHESHSRNWYKSDQKAYRDMLMTKYSIDTNTELPYLIKELTQR